jgi:hypothetical protein
MGWLISAACPTPQTCGAPHLSLFSLGQATLDMQLQAVAAVVLPPQAVMVVVVVVLPPQAAAVPLPARPVQSAALRVRLWGRSLGCGSLCRTAVRHQLGPSC